MNKYKSVFGKFENRRWTVLLGGFFLSLVGGMSYAWGSFIVPSARRAMVQKYHQLKLYDLASYMIFKKNMEKHNDQY